MRSLYMNFLSFKKGWLSMGFFALAGFLAFVVVVIFLTILNCVKKIVDKKQGSSKSQDEN